mmetsp:Transcript_96997/g.172640  ORF Transcript_96997/g.172640 Transcript_96997/m.172640 type:complete len:231 (-) Transcript_96997:691-1383(-)
MNGTTCETSLANHIAELLAPLLSTGKHQDLFDPLRIQIPQLPHNLFLLLLPPMCEHNLLRDVLVGRKIIGADLDVDYVLLKVPCQFLYTLWPCCRPEQRLPIWSDLTNNLANIWLKAHVQHAVCLIHDQVCNTAQINHAALNKVNQPPRRCHETVNSILQFSLLVIFGSTAIDDSCSQLVRENFCKLNMDLLSKFSRWCQHKHQWPVATLELGLSLDVQESWNSKGHCFP